MDPSGTRLDDKNAKHHLPAATTNVITLTGARFTAILGPGWNCRKSTKNLPGAEKVCPETTVEKNGVWGGYLLIWVVYHSICTYQKGLSLLRVLGYDQVNYLFAKEAEIDHVIILAQE